MDNVEMTFFWLTWAIILLIVLLLAKIFQLHKDSDVFDEVFKTGQTVNNPNSQTTVQNSVSNFTTPIPDRAVIVQIPEESKNKDNPPDYSNFLPPSYEEAVERDIQSQEELILRYSETIKFIV